jgi:hypothetical protein
VARGNKLFKTGQETELYTLDVLREKHGLLTDAIWHEALTKIAEDKRTYLLSVLRRGTKLSDVRRIRLSTIHGAKVGEAVHVLLFLVLSP